jgi:hypothetical protein
VTTGCETALSPRNLEAEYNSGRPNFTTTMDADDIEDLLFSAGTSPALFDEIASDSSKDELLDEADTGELNLWHSDDSPLLMPAHTDQEVGEYVGLTTVQQQPASKEQCAHGSIRLARDR